MNYLKEFILFESVEKSIEDFIKNSGYKTNSLYPNFLYHATNKEISEFKLDPELDWEDVDGNSAWDIEMPSGVLFLTDDIKEAQVYGRYIIPFELNSNDILKIEVDSNSPSIEFDNDYNYGSEYKLYNRFMNEGTYDCLQIKGHNKSTFVCYIEAIKPRIDIATKFYNKK